MRRRAIHYWLYSWRPKWFHCGTVSNGSELFCGTSAQVTCKRCLEWMKRTRRRET